MPSADPYTRAPVFHPFATDAVEELLLWRNPSQSAAVLGGVTLGFWVLNVVAYSPVVVLATVAQFGVLLCFLINVAAGFLKRYFCVCGRGVHNQVVVHAAHCMMAIPIIIRPQARCACAIVHLRGHQRSRSQGHCSTLHRVHQQVFGYANCGVLGCGLAYGSSGDSSTMCGSLDNTALVERVISGKDAVLTVQVAATLFAVSKVAAVVSPLTLTWLGTCHVLTDALTSLLLHLLCTIPVLNENVYLYTWQLPHSTEIQNQNTTNTTHQTPQVLSRSLRCPSCMN